MRLIDLDDYSHHFCGHDGEYEKWNIDPDAIVPDAVIPTIEPKKGRWIVKRDIKTGVAYGECSSCGMKNYAGHTNFCPNCGTKMEEGDVDAND